MRHSRRTTCWRTSARPYVLPSRFPSAWRARNDGDRPTMKLVIAVVQGKDVDELLRGLTGEGYRATQVSSSGGFLRESNVTLLIGVEDAEVAHVQEIVQANCHSRTQFVNPLMPIVEPGEALLPAPVEVPVGGATVFVVNIDRFERL